MANNTTTIKKPKIDFKAWIKDDKVQPRTLREIHAEVGFPFTAKAVVTYGSDPNRKALPTGIKCTFVKEGRFGYVTDDPSISGDGGTDADYPRWILLGAL